MHDIFAFTDIHGTYNLYKSIMDYCIEQDPECTIIFCGDACDRGPDGYKIMKELLDNPQVIYLKGNHEDMFVKAAYEIKTKFQFQNPEREKVNKILKNCLYYDAKYPDIQISLYNGSMPTLVDWIMDGMSMNFVEEIEHLPLTFSTDTCDFCHSAGVYNTFKRVADAEYNQRDPDSYDATALMWGRATLEYDWTSGRTAIFGHTPTPYLSEYLESFKPEKNWEITPVMFSHNTPKAWKLDMDTGACFTSKAYVLNCLTMKAQGFEMKNGQVEKIEVIQF